MKAKERLAQLQEERASRLRQAEAAQQALEDYTDKMGALSVSGTPIDKITAELARLGNEVTIHNDAAGVLTVALEDAKQQIHVERRQLCAQRAKVAEAELEKHAPKVQKLLDQVRELEECPSVQFAGITYGDTKSARLEHEVKHWRTQAQRMSKGLPETPDPFS